MESGVPLTGALKSDPDSTWGVGVNFGAAVGVGTDVAVADEQASSSAKRATNNPVTNRRFSAGSNMVGITDI